MKILPRFFLLALIFLLAAPAFADVRVEWLGGEKLQRYYDHSTGETLNILGGIFLPDDFIDTAANKTSAPGPWTAGNSLNVDYIKVWQTRGDGS